jgi:uncharacterized membrane protein YfcA
MKRGKPGKRHLLIMYQRNMSRWWKTMLFLALVLVVPWALDFLGVWDLFNQQGRFWMVGAALLSLALSMFTFISRKMAYVQAHPNHLRLVTPFLRLKISYKRIRSIRPANLLQLLPPDQLKWGQRGAVEPFYGTTALVVEVTSFPISPVLLRLFLSPLMFSRGSKGFLILVDDWMGLSTEADSLRSAYSHAHARKTAQAASGRAW